MQPEYRLVHQIVSPDVMPIFIVTVDVVVVSKVETLRSSLMVFVLIKGVLNFLQVKTFILMRNIPQLISEGHCLALLIASDSWQMMRDYLKS